LLFQRIARALYVDRREAGLDHDRRATGIVEEEGDLELVALDRLRPVRGGLAVLAEELDAVGPPRHPHREMDVAALGPAIDLPAAGEHAVLAEIERGVFDDDALVPIILDRMREIDQDMAGPLPEMIAVQPAAFGDGEFGEHAGLELHAVIAGLG